MVFNSPIGTFKITAGVSASTVIGISPFGKVEKAAQGQISPGVKKYNNNSLEGSSSSPRTTRAFPSKMMGRKQASIP